MSRHPSQLRVALVGYGSIGRRHAENLLRLGVRQCIVVRRAQACNPAFRPPAGATIVHSCQQAVAAGVDLAIICNPTSMHAAAASAFASAGVPLLIEKPLCRNLAEALLLARELQEPGQFAGIAYCLRYHPAYQLARQAIAEGSLGRVHCAHAWFESFLPDWHPWEDYRHSYAARSDLGGGVLPTLDHEIDFALWCLGAARQVQGRAWNTGRLEVDTADSAELEITHSTGTRTRIALSLCSPQRRRGFEFAGQRGTLRFNFQEPQLVLHRPGAGPRVLWDGAAYDLGAMYLDLLRDFLYALIHGAAPPVPWTAGLDSLRVCDRVEGIAAAAGPGPRPALPCAVQ
jgi:predicted dehydrogenase